MLIPERLKERLHLLGLNESIYGQRTRKCVLSKERLNMERVPWYSRAYFVNGEASSLIFDPVSIVPCLALDPKPNDRILDMCAAPGTKTYIISFMTNNKASITANDIDSRRILRLTANAKKYGIKCSILNQSGRTLEGNFNKILIDAPCSGEGMVNKKDKLFRHWSERRIKFLSKKQKKLINRGFDMLDGGGTLVYSTCTFAPEENEAVVDFLLKKHSGELAGIDVPITHVSGITSWNGKEFDERVRSCMRIYPHGTGGFFVAKIRKI